MNKDKNNKTRCTKNNYQLTAEQVAGIVGCSVSYVKKIRSGAVNMESKLAKKVLSVDTIAESGKSLLIQEIEKLVKLPA